MIDEITPEDVEMEALDIHRNTGLPVEVCRQLAAHIEWESLPTSQRAAKMAALCEALGVVVESHAHFNGFVWSYHTSLRGPKGLAYLWTEKP